MDHPTLMCDVASLTYEFNTRTGTLVMGDGDCCDMRGCIAVFQAIDPDVRQINTFSGRKRDTEYSLLRSGEWKATPHF